MKIAVIGAGWYGCHIALELKKLGYNVEIFEKNKTIFSGVSGSYGIRLHKGPHYPRSNKTREICSQNFSQFQKLYPDLIIEHEYSYYALGVKDAHGYAPKVDRDLFSAVCHESEECKPLKPENTVFKSIQTIYDIDEPSIALGNKLRTFFEKKLHENAIPVHLDTAVTNICNDENGVLITKNDTTISFDFAINATSFKELATGDELIHLPVNIQVSYQVCLSLIYKDTQPGNKPFSFIVMDGWFPCIMPTVEEEEYNNTYILTHGCFTIMASCQTPELANKLLDSYNDDFIEKGAKLSCEEDMKRYLPNFTERFEYMGWKGTVLAKPRTKSEFRGAITFAKENIVHIIPGKVSNVINAANETLALIQNKNCKVSHNIRYVKDGILDIAEKELSEAPSSKDRSTTNLNIIEDKPIKQHDLNKYSIFTSDKKPESAAKPPHEEEHKMDL